jgi:hypothetical protein
MPGLRPYQTQNNNLDIPSPSNNSDAAHMNAETKFAIWKCQ